MITPDRQMAGLMEAQAPLPALCTPSDGHLSMYQVSFDSLLYVQGYAPDKLFIAKIMKGSNPVNTGDRVMVLAFCNSLHSPLSLYQVSFIYLQYFRDMLRTSLLLQKLERKITLKLLVTELWFLHSALPLMSVYKCIKFNFDTFGDKLWTSFLLQKLRWEVTP